MRYPSRQFVVVVTPMILAASAVAFQAYDVRGQHPPGREPGLSEMMAMTHVNFGAFDPSKANSDPEPEPNPNVVYLNTPVSARAARTWEKLQSVIPMSFPQETPLEDVLKYIREETKGEKDKGLQIYVNPAGLQESEKTHSSPVTIDLDDVPVSKALTLILKQLGMKYQVQEDGLLVITSESDNDFEADPSVKTLNELSALRREVAALRHELGARGVVGPKTRN